MLGLLTGVWMAMFGVAGVLVALGLALAVRDIRKAAGKSPLCLRCVVVAVVLCLPVAGGMGIWYAIHASGGRDDRNEADRTSQPAPQARQAGIESASEHIIYVLDCSGSMVARFDRVRAETCQHVGGLPAESSFHVILFTSGDVVEGPARKPRLATARNKAALVEFMKAIHPLGRAGPADALNRAFEQLADLEGTKKILLIAEAQGLLEGAKATLAVVEEGSKSGDVQVFVLILGPITPEAKQIAVKIAEDTGGRFRHVAGGDL